MEATYLADIEVGAISVDLSIVGIKHRGVDAVRRGNKFAVIIGPNNVSAAAVLADVAQAEDFTGQQVVAATIYLRVHSRKLIAGTRAL